LSMTFERDRQRYPPVHARRIVVSVILADAMQFVAHRDAGRLQYFGIAVFAIFDKKFAYRGSKLISATPQSSLATAAIWSARWSIARVMAEAMAASLGSAARSTNVPRPLRSTRRPSPLEMVHRPVNWH
jgi:hypothetical protein